MTPPPAGVRGVVAGDVVHGAFVGDHLCHARRVGSGGARDLRVTEVGREATSGMKITQATIQIEAFRDFPRFAGATRDAQQWPDFLRASGKLQALCYKEEIEAALRTPGIGGFELLDLHDFPGQGTALVGVLDPFWDSKGYITPAEYRRFCNATVPLARLLKRAWMTGETLSAEIEVAHFGPAPFQRATARWKVLDDDGKAVAEGEFPAGPIPLGQGLSLGRVSVDLAKFAAPGAYRLVVGLDKDERPFLSHLSFSHYLPRSI